MRLAVSLACAFTLLATDAHAETGAWRLRLHGSNTIGEALAPALVEEWLKTRGVTDLRRRATAPEELAITGRDRAGAGVVVEIHAHGSSTAFADLKAGGTDVGMSSRPIKRDEIESLAHLGRLDQGGSEYVIGLDGIAVIVHRSNPLARLDRRDIARVFAGEVSDWAQLGAPAGAIRLYARDDKSGTFDTFKSLVLGKSPLSAGAQRFESSEELSDAVSADPRGIGFIGLPYVRQAKALAVSDGSPVAIAPDAFSVATEDYALARRLFMYVPQNAPTLARSLAEFAVSPRGQALAAREGFVSQELMAGASVQPADAPDEYCALTDGAQRLSVNFRFREGSVAPDSKAERDLARLVELLNREKFAGRKVMLMGFADHHEVIPLHSLELSIHRADHVADLLIARGLAPLRVRGYGSAVPVAANDSDYGRQKNRRVEVWIQ